MTLGRGTTLVSSPAIRPSGTVPFTGDQSMGGFRLTDLPASPTAANDAVGRDWALTQIAAVVAGFDPKPSCRLATAAALPAYTRVGNVLTADVNGALPNIDGVAAVVGDRILHRIGPADVLTHVDLGLYTVTSLGSAGTKWVLTRATDADADADVTYGIHCNVTLGTVNADSEWYLSTPDPIVLNTTPLTFSLWRQGSGQKNNFTAVADPTVNDDSSLGYAVGSRWVRAGTSGVWTCLDVTVGAASWWKHEVAGAAASVAADLATHEGDATNPHGVTAGQAGADVAGSAAAAQAAAEATAAAALNAHEAAFHAAPIDVAAGALPYVLTVGSPKISVDNGVTNGTVQLPLVAGVDEGTRFDVKRLGSGTLDIESQDVGVLIYGVNGVAPATTFSIPTQYDSATVELAAGKARWDLR